MQTVAIFGVGLIGGSFALALKKAGFQGEIVGVSSERSIAQALERGAINRGASFEDAASQADLLYLAHPIEQIIRDIARLKPLLKPGALVTDAGSTKADVLACAKEILGKQFNQFVGGHPIASCSSA